MSVYLSWQSAICYIILIISLDSGTVIIQQPCLFFALVSAMHMEVAQ